MSIGNIIPQTKKQFYFSLTRVTDFRPIDIISDLISKRVTVQTRTAPNNSLTWDGVFDKFVTVHRFTGSGLMSIRTFTDDVRA